MRDALSSLDQLVSFNDGKVTEEAALGVFGLVSRSALENLAWAILKGDTAAILGAIEVFDSAGKNIRRLAGELLMHFRNLAVVQALGPGSKSVAATPDQIKVLEEQAKAVPPGRVFRICDQIAEMEDKVRYALSARTLVEMYLIRAGRVASVASIEELMKAVRGLMDDPRAASAQAPKESFTPPPAPAPAQARTPRSEPSAPPPPAPVAPSAPPPAVEPKTQREMMDDPKLNDILDSIPGATVVGVR